jgi:hypothetical protein
MVLQRLHDEMLAYHFTLGWLMHSLLSRILESVIKIAHFQKNESATV